MCQLQPTKQKESIPNILSLYLSKTCQVLLIASQFWHQTFSVSVFSSRLVWYLVFQPLRSTWSKSLSLPTIWVVASFSYLIIVSYRAFCCGGWLVCVKRDRWSIHSAETKLYIPHCIINCLCTNACSVCCQQLILSLWHCRLGHPSFSRIGH